jgi:integrase/recombinase XerC
MASVFKRRGRGNWIAEWIGDNALRVTRSTRTTDHRLAERLAGEWERAALLRRSGHVDAIADAFVRHESRPITEHLADFRAFLESRGTGSKSIDTTETYLRRIIAATKAARIADLAPSAVQEALGALRQPGVVSPAGLSARSVNAHAQAMRAFARWLHRDRRSRVDLLGSLRRANENADRRRLRRDLSPDELARMIAAAERSPSITFTKRCRERVKDDGSGADRERREVVERETRATWPGRAWAYRIAAATGLRASEVASLTRESFDLDAEPPTITVEAAYSKHRRRDVLPIAADLAAFLRPWLETKARGERVCPMPTGKAATFVRADLAAARAAWIAESRSEAERAERLRSDYLRAVDAAGRVVDFHSLRVRFISAVVDAGANVKQAMELARHSDPKLTLRTYAKVRLVDPSAVVDAIPSTGILAGDGALRATGTDDVRGGPIGRPKRAPNGPQKQQQKQQHSLHDSVRLAASECDGRPAGRAVDDECNSRETADLCEPMPDYAVQSVNASSRTRTLDPLIKSQLLYQLS